jgi:hypothetical protein
LHFGGVRWRLAKGRSVASHSISLPHAFRATTILFCLYPSF